MHSAVSTGECQEMGDGGASQQTLSGETHGARAGWGWVVVRGSKGQKPGFRGVGSAALGAGGRGRWIKRMLRDAQHGSLSPLPSLPMVGNRHLSSRHLVYLSHVVRVSFHP